MILQDRGPGKIGIEHLHLAKLFKSVHAEIFLVNNAIAIPKELTQPGSFWDKPLSNWELIDVGLRSNFVAAWHAAQIMAPQKSGLIVA